MPIQDPVALLAALAALCVLAEWLARRPVLRHLGSALLVIALGAIASNAGLIPAASTPDAPVPVYDAVFGVLAPLGIFWLLLAVRLREVWRAGGRLLLLFAIGVAGTAAGVLLGMRLAGGTGVLGDSASVVAGMYAATYTGGSINFNAVALHYDMMRNGALYGGLVVVDNIVTALWMGATIALPRWLAGARGGGAATTDAAGAAAGAIGARHADAASAPVPLVEVAAETETVTPRGLALTLATGLVALRASEAITAWCATRGVTVPSILVLSTLALLLAQSPVVSRLRGARVLGMVTVLLFLAVIGAFCDVRALRGLGATGPALLVLATATVGMHGLLTFGAARLLRLDPAAAAVASQANVGGATSALALAKSLGREDLLLPGILLGALGNAVGTFVGFAVAAAG